MNAYFDNAATSPLLPAARGALLSAAENFGNPASLHSVGLSAEHMLESCRKTILSALSAPSSDTLVFCGSGTECNNLALRGVAHSKRFFAGKRIVISDSEHPSVINCAEALSKEGFDVIFVPTRLGVIDRDAFESAVNGDTFLVSVMTANNESGAVYDIASLCRTAKRINPGVIFHTDATQAFMKVKLSARSLGVDLITVSAHKIGGCKGVGALYVKDAVIRSRSVVPVVFGGGQEGGLRSGTENTAGIAAFAAAAEYRAAHLAQGIEKMCALRGYIISGLDGTSVRVNSAPACSPAIISVTLPGIKSETMLQYLSSKGVFVSSGSACSSHHPGISRAMKAFGLSDREADCTLRVSLSPENTEEEADLLLTELKNGINSLIRAY